MHRVGLGLFEDRMGYFIADCQTEGFSFCFVIHLGPAINRHKTIDIPPPSSNRKIAPKALNPSPIIFQTDSFIMSKPSFLIIVVKRKNFDRIAIEDIL